VHVDRLVVDDGLVLIQVSNEGIDAAFVQELVALAVVPLIVNRDRDAAVEKRELAQALGQRIEAELDRLEYLRIGPKRDLRAPLLGRAGDFELADSLAAFV
jgi:hypothetical protein